MKSFFKRLRAKFTKVKAVNCEAIRKLYRNRLTAKNQLHEITENNAGTDKRGELWIQYGQILQSDIHILTELYCSDTVLTKEDRKLVNESTKLILNHLETCFKDAEARRNPMLSMQELEDRAQISAREQIAGKPSTLG